MNEFKRRHIFYSIHTRQSFEISNRLVAHTYKRFPTVVVFNTVTSKNQPPLSYPCVKLHSILCRKYNITYYISFMKYYVDGWRCSHVFHLYPVTQTYWRTHGES